MCDYPLARNLIVRTLLVPSTVALLGRWNWWPSKHGQPVEATPDLEQRRVLNEAAGHRQSGGHA